MAILRCDCVKLLISIRTLMPKYTISIAAAGSNKLSPYLLQRNVSQTTGEINSQPPRKKRDKLTVLRVLSSTVENNPSRAEYPFYDDLLMNPSNQKKKEAFKTAIEDGKQMADFILSNHKDLFPYRKPVPAWSQNALSIANMKMSVENMKVLMRDGDNGAIVVQWYNKMSKAGTKLSIDVRNDVLEYVAFHAVTTGEGIGGKTDLFAWGLFGDLKDKGDSRTYEVFILGLLENGEIEDAFDIYREFTQRKSCNPHNFHGSLHLYNTLLSHLLDVTDGISKEDRILSLYKDIIAAMKQDNIKPDVVTFNSLMLIVSERPGNTTNVCIAMLQEMKKLEIRPSLGSYYYILRAHGRVPSRSLLNAIIKEIKESAVDLYLKHPADGELLSYAMAGARYLQDMNLTKEVVKVVEEMNLKHLLINTSQDSSGVNGFNHFYNNYISALSRVEDDAEYIYNEYKNIIAMQVTPMIHTNHHIMWAFHRLEDPRRLPDLFDLLRRHRMPFIAQSVEPCFSAMLKNIPKERAKDFLKVVNEVEYFMDLYQFPKTRLSVSVSIHVFCLCGQYEEVQRRVEESEELNISLNEQALISILELHISAGKYNEALNTLKVIGKQENMSDTLQKIISGTSFLSDKKELIESWFFTYPK